MEALEKNFIIVAADKRSSVHIDNKGKYILILGKEPTQELDDTTLTVEAKCIINFTQPSKRFVNIHFNGRNTF